MARQPSQPRDHALREMIYNTFYGNQGTFDHYGIEEEEFEAFMFGEVKMTDNMAQALSSVFGSSPEYWLNLQANYDKE